MRLFIAINLDKDVREAVCKVRDQIADMAQDCRPSRDENLHLTLAFLGDVAPSKIAKIKKAMEKSVNKSFNIAFSGIGRFKRREGDLWWMGVEREPNLWALAEKLHISLTEDGFILEEREFKPHLTLCRNVIMSKDVGINSISAERLLQPVNAIHLMESSRVKGVLTYTPLVSVPIAEK